jgi:hypothetical protein
MAKKSSGDPLSKKLRFAVPKDISPDKRPLVEASVKRMNTALDQITLKIARLYKKSREAYDNIANADFNRVKYNGPNPNDIDSDISALESMRRALIDAEGIAETHKKMKLSVNTDARSIANDYYERFGSSLTPFQARAFQERFWGPMTDDKAVEYFGEKSILKPSNKTTSKNKW